MRANDTNKIIFPELSYKLVGLLFEAHNKIGRFGREKQYSDFLEKLFKTNRIIFEREKVLPVGCLENKFTNRVDFGVEGQILLELKAKPIVTKEDYYQMNRYLDASGYKLGIIVNFRRQYLQPIRVIRANS